MKIMTPDISTENSIGTISIERIDIVYIYRSDVPMVVNLE